ncbi:MAG: DEAD/DEAH box helicase, partial [Flavobacteriales bacterium]
KTKIKVKKIAFDLIKLYAKRKTQKGFSYSPDTYLQHELEASFMFEDTPDQLKATQAVKSDMESDRVMDRLICGDVGFGKTEVAIRAAFKAATDGKQVAILVPTTILAFQHHNSFLKRLQNMPIRVDYLNRFRTAKEKRLILEDLEKGKIDIIIGTHQLVHKNVIFKNLGLLIIDEEHKFGVNVKDKLKTLRENIDTLTLTATPIPRTLQFSLMAARDLSVMKTPPPNRQPIDTQIVKFNEETIRDAISLEITRGGQVFFIHNRLENIKEVAGMIQRLVPEAKVAIGHGQMDGKKLEELMLSFIDGEFDVLVSTTIVESGLDVPNANTMIINNAQNFGLADLHQMRGRVGRSNRKAFCYLIAPPYSAITEDARKRLQAVEQFSDLGAGFNIAMKDLEIRGAGNLLGGEQSGFITDIGFDTYQKILNEAIIELKENDFKELFEETTSDDIINIIDEVNIDTDFEILIPDNYVNNVEERLILYNELNAVENPDQLQSYKRNLIDRFGAIPTEVDDLLKSVALKWVCRDLGFEKMVLKKNIMLCYFIKNPKSSYYQSGKFQKVLLHVQQTKLAQVKEKQNKEGIPILMLRFEQVNSIEKALELLHGFKL